MITAVFGHGPVNLGAYLINGFVDFFQMVFPKTWEGVTNATQKIDEFTTGLVAGHEDVIAAFVAKKGVNGLADLLQKELGGPGNPGGALEPPQLKPIFEIPLFSAGGLEISLGIGEPTKLFDALSDVGKETWREIRRGNLLPGDEVWKPFARRNTYIFAVGIGLAWRF